MRIESTNEKPLVSVIIPAYCCAGTLAQAIDSVLCQEVPLEVLVIDDGSPEDLAQVMSAYREDPRVAYYRNPQNLGAAESRNRGVALSRGEYIAFLDADDVWVKGKLQRQLETLRQSGAALCCTARELLTPEGDRTGRIIRVREKITYRDLLRHNGINCSSVLLPRETALAFPMHHADSHEDYICWLEILEKGGFALGIDEPLLLYRLSHTGKSGNKLHSARMTFRTYRYMGFSVPKSLACFCSYALCGGAKYLFAGRKKP